MPSVAAPDPRFASSLVLGGPPREASAKARLEVIDFVGNHRVFASRLLHPLSLVPSPAGSAATASLAVWKKYRAQRAELGRRPTPTELLHAGYLPLPVSADHGSWFEFCGSEGDLSADEQAAATAAPAPQWPRMLQPTSLTKSYKMVVLRVLLDHDELWDGREIPRLAVA